MIRRGWMAAAVVCAAVGLLPATADAGIPAWTTYHHDSARSGIDPDSTSPVAPTQVWQSPALDGEVFGEPLVYGSRVYVATENDTVYALDFSTGAVVWHHNLGTPVSDTVLPGTGDINPTVGITSTPAIDPTTGRIYVVADTWDGKNASSVEHVMYALNLSDGSVAVGPVPVDPPGSVPTAQLQRESLALDAGKVIIGYGGNSGDQGNYHGWLVAVPEGGGSLQAFEADKQPGDLQGAIWGSGNAPAIDSSGNIWTATGNGSSTNFDYSESVLKLDPNMNLLAWFAPSTWQSLDSGDADLGSTVPLLLPDGLVFEIGKQGIGYLLNASDLGNPTGTSGTFDHWLYSAPVCSGSWGGGIYVGGVIYVACSDGMYALKLDTATNTFAPLSTWKVDGNAISPPIFAGGLIWSADYNGSNLYGLDPSTGAETFVSANLSGFEHFATPSAAGGLLFVANNAASGNDQVTAFQIAKPAPPSATTVMVSSSSNPALVNRPVTLTAAVAPGPDAGTVAFSDGGTLIAGCGAVPVSVATGQATCATTFHIAGEHGIVAKYSGDAYYLGASGSLTQSVVVVPPGIPPPTISHLRVRVVHRRLRLSLTLSEPARLTVVVWRLVPGRRVHQRCRARARHGRRCTAAFVKLKIHINAPAGADRFRPRMPALPPGRYLVTVTAVAANGGRSLPNSVVVTVPRR